MIARCAENFSCDARISRLGEVVGANSIFGVMMLAAACGTTVDISANGPGAKECVQSLTKLISTAFFEGDFFKVLESYIGNTATTDINAVMHAATSTNDLALWYIRAEPRLEAADIVREATAFVSGIHIISDGELDRYDRRELDRTSLERLRRASDDGERTSLIKCDNFRVVRFGRTDNERFCKYVQNYLSSKLR